MPQQVRIEGGPAETVISSREMKNGLAYLVVSDGTGSGFVPGDVVIKAYQYVSHPRTQAYFSHSSDLKVRELRAGEKVVFEGS